MQSRLDDRPSPSAMGIYRLKERKAEPLMASLEMEIARRWREVVGRG